MKKIGALLMVSLLLCGGMGVAAISNGHAPLKEKRTTHSIRIDFNTHLFDINDDLYLQPRLNAQESYIMNPGKPMLPRLIKTIELPFGVKNIKVQITPLGVHEKHIRQEIVPAPSPLPLTPQKGVTPFPLKDAKIYGSSNPFPPNWYSYHVGCGLNDENNHVTFITLNLYPIIYFPSQGKLEMVNSSEIEISFSQAKNTVFPVANEYDLVIISPSLFAPDLQRLIDHKNNYNVKTFLKTTEEIYEEYSGVDEPEQIKFFIKDALERWGVKYVLLVGGLTSIIYAKPRDHTNYGVSGWHVPVRYSNLISGEPGYLCDLYYSDIYKEGGAFESWDSNGNGIFAEWPQEDGPPEDIIDLYPDVALGRLACRNRQEVQDVVNKIINYETTTFGSDWFTKIISISGDGFLDQEDLDVEWNTEGVPNGDYTIYAQSTNNEGETGPVDVTHITLDTQQETRLSFNHDDHLNPAIANGYPAPPIAEIVSVSEGNILGNTDYKYTPGYSEAYCNDLFWWANVSYVDKVLHIRGKSYDPKPYGNITHFKVWIENNKGEIIFTDYRNNTKTYYEGEWVTGEKSVNGRGGALYYMPEEFDREIVWTSNGKFSDQDDVIESFSKGYGFAFFSGHGSPGWWGDHFPGIPGNRRNSQVAGLVVSQVSPFFPYFDVPLFPMNKLSNTDKLPVVVVGGCHNSMFNISLVPTILDLFLPLWMHTYGHPLTECWGWYMVKLPRTGAIATMGNTGYGWGWEGEYCTIGGGDGWITSEFFRQYGENQYDVLGTTYSQTLTSYISNFREFTLPECYWYPDLGWDWVDEKTVQQWVLLGDPSLKIGGYPS